MRTLLVLGVLSVFVLLVTPSNGEGPQDGGGEKEVSSLKEFIGQNEDGRADWMEDAPSLSMDWQVLPRSRRQEPGRKKKRCPGCFSALSVKEKSSRIRRDEKTEKKKPCPGCYTPLVVKEKSSRIRRDEKQEPPTPSKTEKKKRCRGCYTPLVFEGTTSRIRREKKERIKSKLTKKPRRTGSRGLVSWSGKDSRRKGRKRNGGKKRRLEKTEEGTRRGHRDDHPEGVKEEKIKQRFGTHSLLSSSRPGGTTEDLTGGKETEEGMRRGHHDDHPEGVKEEKIKRRFGTHSLLTSSRPGGTTEDLTDGKEMEEGKRRGHRRRHRHRHHHHHPEGEKDDLPRSEGITEDLTDGKEPAEKTKRHSDDQNKKKGQKIKLRVGSRSPIASLPS